MKQQQFDCIRVQAMRLAAMDTSLYHAKFAGLDLAGMKNQEDFETLPFTDKADLRQAYPLGLAAVPMEQVVRIHSSSGTTGTPVIIPYTKMDVEDWAVQFDRCYEIAGCTPEDRIQITPGYGLWTAGIGFQDGAELLGAMAIPMGPGNTEKQLTFMRDMGATVLCATSSYALLLTEEIEKRGMRSQLKLKKGVIGSERWGEKTRRRIREGLGIELYDIYGLTEIYGPGIGINCAYDCGMHVFDDFCYYEIIDPDTGKTVPDGQMGELVITTLRKEGAPLIRFRTHDITRFIPGKCPCGRDYPRIDVIMGRSDDLFKVKGVNMYPAQVEEILRAVPGTSSEYQVEICHADGKDRMTVSFETAEPESRYGDLEAQVRTLFKSRLGMTPEARAVGMGVLPRSEKKTKRVYDLRG